MTSALTANQMRALIYIVLEHQAFVDRKRQDNVATNEVSKHLGLEHKDAMKVISMLRKNKLVGLRERKSKGPLGYGYDGALFGVLTPSTEAIERVRGYLRVRR